MTSEPKIFSAQELEQRWLRLKDAEFLRACGIKVEEGRLPKLADVLKIVKAVNRLPEKPSTEE
jgi:hypothetical protein